MQSHFNYYRHWFCCTILSPRQLINIINSRAEKTKCGLGGGNGVPAARCGFVKRDKRHSKRRMECKGQEGEVVERHREQHGCGCESQQPAGGCGGLREEERRRAMESAEDSQQNCVGCGLLKRKSCLHCQPAPAPVLCEELLAFHQQDQRSWNVSFTQGS